MDKGKIGEDLAAKYLIKYGFIIDNRNFHSRYGEIDIIAHNEFFMCFVEIKLRSSDSLSLPREAVGITKQRKIVKTAQMYLSSNPTILQPRFDVCEIYDNGDENYYINYLKNAFGMECLHGSF